MDLSVHTMVPSVLAITPSGILIVAGALCLLVLLGILLMKRRPSGSPDHSAEVSEHADYAAIAGGVLAGIGGADNISALDCCVTRLRVQVKDFTAVNEKAIKAAGASGVIRPDKNSCQVILGPKARFVYDELKKML